MNESLNRMTAATAPAAVREAGPDRFASTPPSSLRLRIAGLALLTSAAIVLAGESPVQTQRCVDCEVDRNFLRDFYTKTNGEDWTHRNNWNDTSISIAEWYGLETTDGPGAGEITVTVMDLPDNNLSGTVPSKFGRTNSGSIYDGDQMVYLRRVNLSDNKLSGSLPRFRTASLRQRNPVFTSPATDILPSLKYLDLSGNGFSGEIPSFYVPFSLEHLDLSSNNLSGNIYRLYYSSSERSNSRLKYVYLSHNSLSGGLGNTFGGLRNLRRVDLSHNELSGLVFRHGSPFSSSSDLTYLDLSYNEFGGPLNMWRLLYAHPNLKHLDLSHNRFEGELKDLPADLSLSDPSLEFLDLRGNPGLCVQEDNEALREWLAKINEFHEPECGEGEADLIVESPMVSPVALSPGAWFTLSATVRNRGTEPAAETELHFYHSTTKVGTEPVASLEADGTSDKSIRLMAPASPGTYYYIACVDRVNRVSGELDTEYHCSGSVAITVGADLVVESPMASDSDLRPGESFTLSATVRNQGTGPAGETQLRYYVSPYAVLFRIAGVVLFATEVGSVQVPGLDAGGTTRQPLPLNAPTELGTHYYHVCVDGISGENNSNNCSSGGVEVTVTAGATSGTRDPDKDFNTLGAAGNNEPYGIWSDGTTMWVSDWLDAKIYAYSMATRDRDPDRDFDTLIAAGNDSPRGIWSDGATMWVSDFRDNKVYAYSMATRSHHPEKDFDAVRAAGSAGIWSDSITMWIADFLESKIYAHSMATRSHDPDKDFNTLLAAGNQRPEGIWSDGVTMWVTDNGGFGEHAGGPPNKVYAYSMATRSREPGRDLDTLHAAGNHRPRGMWSDGATMWIVDVLEDKLYAYRLGTPGGGRRTPGTRDPDKDFNTLSAAGNNEPYGMWSDGVTMWVSDWLDAKIYAYSMATRDRDPGRDFDTLIAAGNDSPRGIWSDGVTMWVSDFRDNKVYAYSMATRSHHPDKDFDAARAAGSAGIWSDSITMWVADFLESKIYAHSMATRSHDPDKDFNTLIAAGNQRPEGIWSDGVTMWVTDNGGFGEHAGGPPNKVYAYSMATRSREPGRDLDTLHAAGNHRPRGDVVRWRHDVDSGRS